MDKDAKIASQINKLEEKYKNSGQDLSSYLDGLLYERYLTYWDYIHLDTLLSLQVPRTHFPDEEIFIMYHQITELYFKLILHEEKQIVNQKCLVLFVIKFYFDVLGVPALIDFSDELVRLAIVHSKIAFVGIVHLKKNASEARGLSPAHHMVHRNPV